METAYFQDQVAVVTGGATGIGEACVRLLVGQGCKCIIIDTDESRGVAVVHSLPEGSSSFLKADIADEKQVKQLAQSVTDAYGRVDILINAAGISSFFGPALVEDTELADWKRMMSINLDGTFLMIKHLILGMKRQGYGRIVNIASTAAIGGGYRGQSPYCASKAGIVGLTYAIAREGGPYGITCNAIGPGPTKTPSRQQLVEQEAAFSATVPVGFVGEAPDIAHPIVFLCSRQARFVTGQLLFVDGGASIPWNIDHIVPPPIPKGIVLASLQ